MYMIIGGDGKEYGHKPDSEVREWIAEGRLNAQSQIREQSDADWKTLADLPEFAGDLYGATPSTLQPLPPAPAAPAAPTITRKPTLSTVPKRRVVPTAWPSPA